MSRSHSKPPSHRQLKIGQELRQVISQFFISGEYYHPLLESVMITITEVKVSADLKVASAFIFLPKNVKPSPILLTLKEMAPEIRKFIAKTLALRYVPEIRFFFDDTEEQVQKIENIFSKLHNKK